MFVEVTAPLGALGVARTSLPPGIKIEFERAATVPSQRTSSIRITGAGIDDVIADVRDSPFVNEVLLFSETPERSVYWITWNDTRPELVTQVRDADGLFHTAVAEGDHWTIGLRFSEQSAATRFYTRYDDTDHPITVQKTRQNGSSEPTLDDVLTGEQRAALICAVNAGYFEVPRRTTLVELADELGISDSAVSQRLRRGMLNILQNGTSPPIATIGAGLNETR